MIHAKLLSPFAARSLARGAAQRSRGGQPFLNLAMMSTISEVITKDHRELKQYYDEIINNTKNADHQTRFANQFTWELARHSVGEELVVYPAFEKFLGDKGHEMAEHDRKEHHEVSSFLSGEETMMYSHSIPDSLTYSQVKRMLKIFQNLKPADEDFIPTLKAIWSSLEHHIKEEEEHDMPALEEAFRNSHKASTNESESMAKSFGRTKAFVPSRSHPSAGEHPPFETAMGLLTAPFDHVADIFRKFPDGTISPNPSTK
jgi:hemerythrin-like domain-containing protein